MSSFWGSLGLQSKILFQGEEREGGKMGWGKGGKETECTCTQCVLTDGLLVTLGYGMFIRIPSALRWVGYGKLKVA